jgi:hypothetical protein
LEQIKYINTKSLYKITVTQQLLLLSPMIISNAILLVIYFYFFGYGAPNQVFYIVFLFRLLTDVLPVIILHLQYLSKNWGNRLIMDSERRVFGYGPNNQSVEHSFEAYRYMKMTLNDQSEIVVTCLMINKIEKELELALEMKANKHLRVLALIYK